MFETLIRVAADLGEAAPAQLDLTNSSHLEQAQAGATALLAASTGPEVLTRLEAALIADGQTPLQVHLAVKLARSRVDLRRCPEGAHLSVVFAVYKEHQRIRRADEVAGGEDFLVRKMAQLDWLTADRPDITWDLTVVDDGCPENSGGLAADIIARENRGQVARVLFLGEAIAAGEPVTRPLTDPSESMKGGAIQLGLWEAARVQRPHHAVLFTDADLSTHLGQAGLLMAPILADGRDVAIGSRREPSSVVLKQGTRNTRGKLFIYLWKRLISSLPDVIDTQCGFKAFDAAVVRDIVPDMLEKKFAFDIELLIKSRLRRPDGLERVGVAWIDSDVLSTTTDLQPYLPMLRAMVDMYRHYLPAEPGADTFADFIAGLDDAAWERLQTNIPAAITDREPAEFTEFAGVTAADLKAAAQ